MGWLALLLLAAVLLLLGRFWWRLPRPALTLLAAAFALGGAGYALTGRPELPGRPVAERPRLAPAPPLVDPAERDLIFGTFTGATAWLRMGEAYAREGDMAGAIALYQSALRTTPRDPALWIALGDALARHGRGVNPASTLAFERAVAVAPAHPGPRYYLGLAQLASNKPEAALASWREALARTTPATTWRPALEARIAILEASLTSRAPSSPAARRS